jgi:hypothetical protein
MPLHECQTCQYSTTVISHFKQHVQTKQHIDNMCSLPKDTVLTCMKCKQYQTVQKCNFRRHALSCKGVKSDVIMCPTCKKQYKSRNGLYQHKKKCPNTNSASTIHEIVMKEVVDKLVTEVRQSLLLQGVMKENAT